MNTSHTRRWPWKLWFARDFRTKFLMLNKNGQTFEHSKRSKFVGEIGLGLETGFLQILNIQQTTDLRAVLIASSSFSSSVMLTFKTCGGPMNFSAYGCWLDNWIDWLMMNQWINQQTALNVGLSAKNLSVSRPFPTLNMGFINIAPFAIASSGAGPSYGKPKPTKTKTVM